jgi:hypothetical protein
MDSTNATAFDTAARPTQEELDAFAKAIEEAAIQNDEAALRELVERFHERHGAEALVDARFFFEPNGGKLRASFVPAAGASILELSLYTPLDEPFETALRLVGRETMRSVGVAPFVVDFEDRVSGEDPAAYFSRLERVALLAPPEAFDEKTMLDLCWPATLPFAVFLVGRGLGVGEPASANRLWETIAHSRWWANSDLTGLIERLAPFSDFSRVDPQSGHSEPLAPFLRRLTDAGASGLGAWLLPLADAAAARLPVPAGAQELFDRFGHTGKLPRLEACLTAAAEAKELAESIAVAKSGAEFTAADADAPAGAAAPRRAPRAL